MMKKITSITLISLVLVYFIAGCASIEKSEIKNKENVSKLATSNNITLSEENIYGVYTNDIKSLLEASPIGSEISLKEGENGEWHLKIEKIFTAENISIEASEYFEDAVVEEDTFGTPIPSNLDVPEILTI
jgi:hypothetical protein